MAGARSNQRGRRRAESRLAVTQSSSKCCVFVTCSPQTWVKQLRKRIMTSSANALVAPLPVATSSDQIDNPRPASYLINARTVWISDIHLGFRDCKADYLLDF